MKTTTHSTRSFVRVKHFSFFFALFFELLSPFARGAFNALIVSA